MNKQDLFFNCMMSFGMIGLMVGVFGRFETVTFISGTFILVIWVSFVAIRRNDASRKQIEELKRRIELMQHPRSSESDSESGKDAETPSDPADAGNRD